MIASDQASGFKTILPKTIRSSINRSASYTSVSGITLLIDNAINKARGQGYAKFQLDVMSDNPAVEFYRAVGLELLADTRAPKPAAFGVPPEYRMGMRLS